MEINDYCIAIYFVSFFLNTRLMYCNIIFSFTILLYCYLHIEINFSKRTLAVTIREKRNHSVRLITINMQYTYMP